MPNWHADEASDFRWHTCSTFSAVFANTRFREVVTDARCQLQFHVSYEENSNFLRLANVSCKRLRGKQRVSLRRVKKNKIC